ncbi:hypothetical protein BGZ76_001844 [Entomortierella beljakovae]|nr:hypothetical protein BGZ76_001844 [Entomortierella beljakovae]
MSARRFADAQALVSVGANVTRKFFALEANHLKAYAATSSLLKKSNKINSETVESTPSNQQTHQSTQYSTSTTSSPISTGSAWIDQTLFSASSALKSVNIHVSQSQTANITDTEPSLLDPSFLASPAAHGYKGPTITTVSPPNSSSTSSPTSSSSSNVSSTPGNVKEVPTNRDVLETLLRESKWLDSLPAEDITMLNAGSTDVSDRWIPKERIGPKIMVYESLTQSADDEDIAHDESEESVETHASSELKMASSTPNSLPPITSKDTTSALFETQSTNVTAKSPLPSYDNESVSSSEPRTSGPTHSSDDLPSENTIEKKKLSEAPMPTSRVSRLFHYGGLAASLGVGALTETVRRSVGYGTTSSESPIFLTPANMDRLVNKLTKMRGAALKLGQMLSIQDNKLLSKELEEVLLRVQNSANFMPEKQMRKVMSQTMGSNWESEFTDFNMVPIAAASIGQVHRAVHRATGMPVAIKVQYPGVAASIDSDLANIKTLVLMSSILPRGMYLDNTIKVAQRELGWETDYLREAECIEEFGRLLKDDPDYQVPRLVREASGPMVLTMEWMQGEPMTYAMQSCDQASRDRIGTSILSLCLRELFDFQYMQTDPNWTNFLYNPRSTKLELLDFGATRGFDQKFTSLYLKTILAGAAGDRDGCLKYSRELGFLTGAETPVMETAHIDSLLTLSEPFQESAPDVYDFKYQTITQRVKDEIPTMLKYRLTPPPDETYSLHRKMAGAFLLCSKLGARVESKKLFREITGRYREEVVDERRGLNYGRGA